MKRYCVFFLFFFAYSQLFAMPLRHIVFFGDSYMDNGNLYKLLLHVLPKSPPYYEGRFSNGPTWAELVGEHYHKQYRFDYTIYAVGGATAIFHLPTSKFIAPTTLSLEIKKYLLDHYSEDKSTTLFIIWIGDNDYMFDQEASPETATQKVVDGIRTAIADLIDRGALHFLIFNLFDTTQTPMILEQGSPQHLLHLINLHNQKLASALMTLQKEHRRVQMDVMDVHTLFDDILVNTEKYNEQYQLAITQKTKACWTGGLTLDEALTSDTIKKQLQIQFTATNTSTLAALVTQYASQPTTLDTMPCAHPNEYLFWDSLHPTATLHALLAQKVIEQLDTTMP